jgi:hypothetical protein
MKPSFATLALLGSGYAFPAIVMQQMAELIDREPSVPTESMLRARQLNAEESNCGPIPCTTFNETEQLVSVDGVHAFVAPVASDRRGPCPGLNAAANHGYLPHNGIPTIGQSTHSMCRSYSNTADPI